MTEIIQNKSILRSLVGVDTNMCSYFVWTSWLGIKYMKHFLTPEEAIIYLEQNPRRFGILEIPLTEKIKKELSEELRQQLINKVCTYSFLKPILLILEILLVVSVSSWFFSFLTGLFPSEPNALQNILMFITHGISLILFFVQLVMVAIFVIYTPLKVIERLTFRKIIKNHQSKGNKSDAV